MRLKSYMDENRITQQELADFLVISQSKVSRLINGLTKPTHSEKLLIKSWSGGEVGKKKDDWK